MAVVPPSLSPQRGPCGSELIRADQLLAWRKGMLALGGRSVDLDWLIDLAGGLGWSQLQALWLHPGQQVTLQRNTGAIEALWRRHLAQAEPLQYLVGLCPWRDLELAVEPGVLIPRQETELMVDLALNLLPPSARCEVLRWADLGTGSGCLAIALARALPCSHGWAVDVSPPALRVAAANIARTGLRQRLTLLRSDWWQGLKPWWGTLALVVANPPYIPTSTLDSLDPVVRDHEPRLALDGGADGLAAMRQLVDGAGLALAPGGVLLVEHHHDQSGAVCGLLEQAGLVDVQPHRDLEGIRRFASARRPLLSKGG